MKNNSPTKPGYAPFAAPILSVMIDYKFERPKPTAHKSNEPIEIVQITNSEALFDQLFPLGKVMATALVRQKVCPSCVGYAIRCHSLGNWGEVSEFDAMANEEAVKNGGRILSAFICGGAGRFLVVTEADRSVTTVMLPDEA